MNRTFRSSLTAMAVSLSISVVFIGALSNQCSPTLAVGINLRGVATEKAAALPSIHNIAWVSNSSSLPKDDVQTLLVNVPGTSSHASFLLKNDQSYLLFDVLRGANKARSGLWSWDIVRTKGTRETAGLPAEKALNLLWWDGCRHSSISSYTPPHNEIERGEITKLKIAPAGLPTQWIAGATKTESHRWQASLQTFLSRPGPDIQSAQKQTQLFKTVMEGGETGGKLCEKIAKAFEERAVTLEEPFDRAVSKAAFFRSLKGRARITKSLIVFQYLGALADKMALDRERADRLAAVLNWADRNNVKLDPSFKREARTLIAEVGNFQASATGLLVDIIVDSVSSEVSDKVTTAAVKALGQKLAEIAVAKGATRLGGGAAFASGVLAAYGAGSLIGDYAFNTGGIYDGTKTALFCSRSADEIDKVIHAAGAPINTEQFANAVYLHELAVSGYHESYAKTVEGARLSKPGAKFLANLIGHETPEEIVANHRQKSERAAIGAESWLHPVPPKWLLSRRSVSAIPPTPTATSDASLPNAAVSAPVLVIDRSGSITGRSGVMQQVQQKAEEVVRAIQKNVTQAAIINFSGANEAKMDAPFTADTATLLSAIRSPTVSSNGTAIYDAVFAAVDEAVRQNERPMLILLTDGCNNQGRGFEEALRFCQKRNVSVLIVGFEGTEGRRDDDLQRFAQSTGGFYARSEASNIDDILSRFRLYSTNKIISRPRGRAN